MRKFAAICLAFCLTSLFSLVALGAEYKEGVHYTKIGETLTPNPEVREYFSFYCPHCLKFEPVMADLKKLLPDNVKFERNHVDFLRAASPEIQAMLSKGVVVAEQLDMEEKLVGSLFNYIQVQRAIISSEKDIRNVFVLNGADGEKFDQLMKSFSVNSKAKKMKKNQDELSAKGVLTGVPTLIINGKYRLDTDNLDRNNFVQDYHQLALYLLTLK